MRTRCLVLFSLIGFLAIGCRQSPYMHAHLELLNAEKRALEDQLYDLEFDYEDAIREIAKLKQQNERLHGSGGTSSRDSNLLGPQRGSSSPAKDTGPKSNLAPPTVEEGTLVEPRIELPPSSGTRELPTPKPEVAPRSQSPAPPPMPPRSSAKPGGRKSSTDVEVPTRILSLEPADPRVTHIFVNPLLTGGSDFDRQPGDDGIVVVIEPRNRDDAFVPLAGPITVLVLDPAKTPEQGRILARWEIPANEAQQTLRNSPTVRGIQLRLPWSATPPQTSRLQLHVRYLTVDNRDLRAERDLFITLPGQFSQRWTPRAATRPTVDARTNVAAPQTVDLAPESAPGSTSPGHSQLTGESTGPKESTTKLDAPPIPSSSAPSQATRPEWRPYR